LLSICSPSSRRHPVGTVRVPSCFVGVGITLLAVLFLLPALSVLVVRSRLISFPAVVLHFLRCFVVFAGMAQWCSSA
jgi:type IV secretory pathway VirB3-like protein